MAYKLKMLQIDGELKIANTGKDESTGELMTREYRVQGTVRWVNCVWKKAAIPKTQAGKRL